MIGAFEKDGVSMLCFWNINRSTINESSPDREIRAPSQVRSVTSNPTQPNILFVGFNNGDVRLLIDNDWSDSHMAHTQSVTTLSWSDSNPQMIISVSQDSTISAWRYSKSKQQVERKNIYKTKKNYGCAKAISVELEKFLLVAYDTNIFVIYEFPFSPIKSSGSDSPGKSELLPKRVFKHSFDVPFTAASALRTLLLKY